jgi:hypothetical protein
VLAGGGAEEDAVRARLGDQGTFLGRLGGRGLARVYASADVSCSPARLTRSGRYSSKPRRALCPWSRSTPAVLRR